LSEIREKQQVEDLTEEERQAYYRHLDQVNYEEGVIEHSHSEGIIKGRAEGEEERLKLQQVIEEDKKTIAEKDREIAELKRQLGK